MWKYRIIPLSPLLEYRDRDGRLYTLERRKPGVPYNRDDTVLTSFGMAVKVYRDD